ncbi:MAG: hypothetical protein WDO15_15325 [Bacteroidota bacterium]
MLSFFFLSSCKTKQAETNLTIEPRWEKIGPGGGGATFIPTFSYESTNEFLVRCDMTGAYITIDGGDSYSQVNFPNGSNHSHTIPTTGTLYI